MDCRFGEFELDEGGRTLRLRGRPLDLQPKIFDLLAYLLRHAGRVVSKDELMEHLWPAVHVTEASLQRAVSLLRKALREGGLADALKSFSGHGYRLAVDRPDLAPLLPGAPGPAAPVLPQPDTTGPLRTTAGARTAAAARDWAKVVACLAACGESELDARDRELWAIALECMGRPGGAAPKLRAAIEAYEAGGEPAGAARCATTLARIHLERGEPAVARGWLARARSLLEAQDAADAEAYLLWMEARFEAFEGRPDAALRIAERAVATAERHGSIPMRALTLAYLGFFNIALGRTEIGLGQQDHAAALAMSSAVDPITGTMIYCNILWSCRCWADWSRANQWADGFESWCEANFAGTTGACELHRAEVLGTKGTLADALAAVERAIAKLPDTEPWALGDAYRVRGDIHAAIGDLAAAMDDYRSAYAAEWDAEPGHAVLRAERGDVDGAISALDRVLAGFGWFALQRRGLILAHRARICARAGRGEEARASLERLAAQFDGWPSPAIRALAMEAEAGIVLAKTAEGGEGLATDDARDAIRFLELARQLWSGIGAEFHAARVRLELAAQLRAIGDLAGAAMEIECASGAARRIGAHRLAAEAAAAGARLAAEMPGASHVPGARPVAEEESAAR